MKMSNRQIDWYNAERRFIFACPTEAEKTKWMKLLNTDFTKTKISQGVAALMHKAMARRTTILEPTKSPDMAGGVKFNLLKALVDDGVKKLNPLKGKPDISVGKNAKTEKVRR
jgi:hypothetical protein